MQPDKQNFIEKSKSDSSKKTDTSKRAVLTVLRLIPYFVLVCLILALGFGLYVGLSILPHYAALRSVYSLATEGQNHLQSAENFVQKQNFLLAGDELKAAQDNFHQAGLNLQGAKSASVFKLAYFQNQFVVAEDLLGMADKLSGSMQKITTIGNEAMNAMKDKNTSFLKIDAETKGRVLQILMDSMNDLKDVSRDLKTVNEQLVDVNRHQPMFIFNKVIDPLQTNLPKIQKTFDSALVMLKVLPAFTGYPDKMTYLLILQNNREMRPSGGFIGTYGILELQNAEIKRFFTDNSYNLDEKAIPFMTKPAPAPVTKYMQVKNWFFRDANWWPDFPTSARKMEELYTVEGGDAKVDGTIAITPTVLEDLMGILGEFKVADLTFNKDNFWEQLQYQVEYGYYKQGIPVEKRKDIIGDLGKQILERLYTLPLSDWPKLIDLIEREVREKQLMIYFHNLDAQKIGMDNGWAGEVKQSDGDYMMLVDANLAALKTDSVMDRTLSYNLRENDKGELLVDAKVNYQNTGTFTWKTTRYRTFTRLYVPRGSILNEIKVGGKVVKPEDVTVEYDFNKTALGVFFEVEPQTSKEVVWSYKLPNSIAEQMKKSGQYTLMIQKQPGITDMNVQLNFEFKRNIKDKEDIEFQVNKKRLKHVEVLRSDQIYTVWFE